LSEKTEVYEAEEELPPLFRERGEWAALVLDKMGLSGKGNEVLMVSCKVVEFTVEAKVNDGAYGSARGYVRLEPENLRIYIPVYNPGQLVDDAGNERLFGQVYRQIARELDQAVYKQASERTDQRTAIQDRKDERKGGVHIGQSAPKQGEVL
jgi:hypothetical protein